MRNDRRYSFSLDDAKRPVEPMAGCQPQPSSIEALRKTTPQPIAFDRSTKQFISSIKMHRLLLYNRWHR